MAIFFIFVRDAIPYFRFTLLILSGAVIALYGLGLDDDGGVAFLPCLASRRDGPGDVAGTQSQACRQCREGSDEDGNYQFEDFFLSHFSRSSV